MDQLKPRKKKPNTKLQFEPGKVFSPEKDIEKDFELDLASARYKAQKGQGGDRRT